MSEIKFRCPACEQHLEAPLEMAGERIACPACEGELQVPLSANGKPVVFISHAQSDHPVAERVLETLEGAGYPCWIAPRNITPGMEWGEAIIDAISQCRIMIVVYSSQSNRSKHVKRELERAVDKEVMIVPFRIEDVPMSKTMEYFLSNPHWLDAFKPPMEDHLRTLLDTVQKLTASVRTDGAPPSGADPDLTTTTARSSGVHRRIVIGSAILLGALLLGAGAFWAAKHGDRRVQTPESTAAARTTPSEIELTEGSLTFRASGIQVRSGGTLPARGSTSLVDRVVLMSDRRDAEACEYESDTFAELSFQISNQSKEAVTLADLQLTLLGMVQLFEDRIAEPKPPNAIEDRHYLYVRLKEQPVTENLDLSTLFSDEDTPVTDMEYGVTGISDSNLVHTLVTSNSMLNLTFGNGQTGKTVVSVFAVDPFDQQAVAEVVINVEGAPSADDNKAVVVVDYALVEFNPGNGIIGADYPARHIDVGMSAGAQAPDRKVNLGTVLSLVHLAPMEHITPCGSGDLLPSNETLYMRPGSFQVFALRVGCRVNLKAATGLKAPDLLIGTKDPRRKLAVSSPEPTGLLGLYMLHGQATSEKGLSARLFADRFFLIEMAPDGGTDPDVTSFVPSGSRSLPLDMLWETLLDKALPSYVETLAYDRAKLCGRVPVDFEAEAASGYCYYGDMASPLRRGTTKPPTGNLVRHPRSNLASLTSVIRKDNPLVGKELDAWLKQSSEEQDPKHALKPRTLRNSMKDAPRPPNPKRLHVRVSP